jgi:hypothetical protein
VEHWTYADEVYEVNSMYLLPDDACTCEAIEAAGDIVNDAQEPYAMPNQNAAP